MYQTAAQLDQNLHQNRKLSKFSLIGAENLNMTSHWRNNWSYQVQYWFLALLGPGGGSKMAHRQVFSL